MSDAEFAELQSNSYLETEFFFYMLPCYYGIIAFLWRYCSIISLDAVYYIKKVQGEWLLKYFESEDESARVSQNLAYKILPASYVIKSKVSLYNSYCYLFMVCLSFISTSSMFFAAKHRAHSLLYFFGFFAWYLSAIILRREHMRDINQSLWVHRFFWIFAATFSITKMFEDYFLPLNLIINIYFIVTNVVLAIYAIYRSQDTDTLEMTHNEDIPSFIKYFFQTVELNSTVRYIFKIQDPINDVIGDTKQFQQTTMGIDQDDLKTIQKSLQHTAANVKEEINLLNTLSRRNIFIDKKLRYVNTNARQRVCYFVLAQIGNDRFEAERTIEEFNYLENQMIDIFSSKNFPKLTFPKINDFITKADSKGRIRRDPANIGTQHANKSQILEQWLQEVTKVPIFMIEPLLSFLNIDAARSAPFITYFQYSFKLFCSKGFLLQKHKQKNNEDKEIQNDRRSMIAYYSEDTKDKGTRNAKFLAIIADKIHFTVDVDLEVLEQGSFGFIITCQSTKKPKIRWSIIKTQDQILALNPKIEEQCRLCVPFYYKIVAPLSKNNHAQKLKEYNKYLSLLLSDTKYYCQSLFIFLRLHPVRLQVDTSNRQATLSQEGPAIDRASNLCSDYSYTGEPFEVIKIRRNKTVKEDNDLYDFVIQKGEIVFGEKNTADLRALRQKLYPIYKGVSTLPQLEFKDSHKVEVKNKIQNFLFKIESLPKIHINRDYLAFYSIGE